MKASSSSSDWKCITCPETTCSTRPSQANGTPGGWARNHTTNARSVGSGWGSWGIGNLLQAPVQAGHVRVVHGMPGRYTTRAVHDHHPSVQIAGRGVTKAFTYSERCSLPGMKHADVLTGDILTPATFSTMYFHVRAVPEPRSVERTPCLHPSDRMSSDRTPRPPPDTRHTSTCCTIP